MRDPDDDLEALLRDTEQALADPSGGVAAAASAPQAAAAELDAATAEPAAPVDGSVTLQVSSDAMEVRASFLPPSEGGQPIDLDRVAAALKRQNVIARIRWDAVREAILQCNTERRSLSDVLVAAGRQPRDEVPAYLVMEPRLLEKPELVEQNRKVDWREATPFVFVSAGEVLARGVRRQPGEMGSNVFGVAMPHGKRVVRFPKPGRNTAWRSGAVVAARSGRFVLHSDDFLVSEVLDIKGHVDYATGNIDFDGDVVIGGEIKRGFRVKASGAIHCRGLVDASEITCGGDLVTSRGILGRGTGRVVAGGLVQARFIENCSIEARAGVQVRTGILNSVVQSLETVSVAPAGAITGGRIVAAHGVVARQIGSPSGTHTQLICGIDFQVARQIDWVRDRNIALAAKLQQVGMRLRGREADNERLKGLHARLQAAIHQLNDTTRRLLGSLDKNEEATVEVTGSVFPGTYVEICHVSFVVDREMRRVRFRLDKSLGRVVPTALT